MLWALPLWASEPICFTTDQVDLMVVKIEQGDMCKQQEPLYEQALTERDLQIDVLKKDTIIFNKKFEECSTQRQTESKIAEEKDKARVQEIKEAGKIQWSLLFGGFGAGAILVGLLVILF